MKTCCASCTWDILIENLIMPHGDCESHCLVLVENDSEQVWDGNLGICLLELPG
jgi:hypothetical protein